MAQEGMLLQIDGSHYRGFVVVSVAVDGDSRMAIPIGVATVG